MCLPFPYLGTSLYFKANCNCTPTPQRVPTAIQKKKKQREQYQSTTGNNRPKQCSNAREAQMVTKTKQCSNVREVNDN